MVTVSEDGFGTSMHYPSCQNGKCTGCVPPITKEILRAQLDSINAEGFLISNPEINEEKLDKIRNLFK